MFVLIEVSSVIACVVEISNSVTKGYSFKVPPVPPRTKTLSPVASKATPLGESSSGATECASTNDAELIS